MEYIDNENYFRHIASSHQNEYFCYPCAIRICGIFQYYKQIIYKIIKFKTSIHTYSF